MRKIAKVLLITSMSLLFCINSDATPVDFSIDPETNNIEIKVAMFDSKNDEQRKNDLLLDSEIYREVIDEHGNRLWIKDDATYSYSPDIAYAVSEKNPNIMISWVGSDPENPSKKFKIVLKRRNSNDNNSKKMIFEKTFEIEKLDI